MTSKNHYRYELLHKYRTTMDELRRIMEEYRNEYGENIESDYNNYISEGLSGINLCVECGVDMGDINGRQLCGKTYCREKS